MDVYESLLNAIEIYNSYKSGKKHLSIEIYWSRMFPISNSSEINGSNVLSKIDTMSPLSNSDHDWIAEVKLVKLTKAADREVGMSFFEKK